MSLALVASPAASVRGSSVFVRDDDVTGSLPLEDTAERASTRRQRRQGPGWEGSPGDGHVALQAGGR